MLSILLNTLRGSLCLRLASTFNHRPVNAYVYIKYVDIHGRDIYATQTIKGVSGDYANGNDYIRNITTYRFVRTEPGRIQFDAKRRGMIKIVYEKEQKGAR